MSRTGSRKVAITVGHGWYMQGATVCRLRYEFGEKHS